MLRFGLLTLILLALPLANAEGSRSASVDPYNTFLWNRANALTHDGLTDTGDWFEWWYYKVVDPASHNAFFFTYAVVNPWDSQGMSKGTQAGVQAGDFHDHILLTQAFPLSQFEASYVRPQVQVGPNNATDKRITGHVRSNGHEIAWDLSIQRDWRFNAMGFSMFIPEISGIYWYPAQASAEMSGWIEVDGRMMNLTHAPAYQDRNWGRSLPAWWTWLTSNHFDNSPETTLAVGGGQPKILNSTYLFSGLCIGLKYRNQDYVFRTIEGDQVNFNIHWGVWQVEAENIRGQKIEISAYAPPSDFLILPFQSPRGSTFYDYEALLGQMSVRLFTRSSVFANWNQIANLTTEDAGIEWGTPTPVKGAINFSMRSKGK